MTSSVESSSTSPYVWRVTVVHVEGEDDKIIVTGTTFYPEEAQARLEAIRQLLLACNLDKSSPEIGYQNLVLTRMISPAGGHFFRAMVTDWCPTQPGIVKVFLVDEGQVNLPVGLSQLCPCPQHLSEIKVPTIYKRFVMADVHPVLGEWSADTINWIKMEIENKSIDAVLREGNEEMSHISPLDPGGVPIASAILSKGGATSKDLSGKQMPRKTEGLPLRSFVYPQRNVDSYERCHVLGIERGPWRFSLQFEEQRAELNELDKKLSLLVQLRKLARAYPKEGDAVICPYGQHYCRGLVVRKAYNQEMAVYCVDKGIMVCKALDDIWLLPEEFVALPVLAHRCCLQGLPDAEDVEVSKKFFALVTNGHLFGRVVEQDETLTTVALILNCQSILRMILPLYYEELVLPEACRAVISSVREEDAVLYLQLVEYQDRLEELQVKLQEQINGRAKGIKLKYGTPCLAIFPEDGMWYRAIVTQADDPLIVHYVDYGNEAAVPADCVKSLDITLVMDLPAQAIPCVLKDVAVRPLNNDLIHKVIGEETVNVQVVGKTAVQFGRSRRNLPVVELFMSEDGVSVNRQLTQLDQKDKDSFYDNRQESRVGKYERKCDKKEKVSTMITTPCASLRLSMINVVPNSRKECKLSWVYSPFRFYLTLMESEPAIEEMKRILNEYYDINPSSKFVEKVKEGWIVAIYGEDSFWHRALVTSCCGPKIRLFLIDSGMKQDAYINQLRALPDSELTVPSQALECFTGDDNVPNAEVFCQLMKMVNRNFLVHFIHFTGGKWKVEFIQEVAHTSDRHTAFPISKAPLQRILSRDRTQKLGMPTGNFNKSLDTVPVSQEPSPRYHSGWRDLKCEFGDERHMHRKESEVSNWRKQSETESNASRKQIEESNWRKQIEDESKTESQIHTSFSRSKQRKDDNWRNQNEGGRRLDFKNNNTGERSLKAESPFDCKSGDSSLAHNRREHFQKNYLPSCETSQYILLENAIGSIQSEVVNGTKNSHRKKNEHNLRGIDRAKCPNEQGRDVEFGLGKKSEDANNSICKDSSFTKLEVPIGELVNVQVTWVLSPLKFYCRLDDSLSASLRAQMKAAQDECNRSLVGGVTHSFTKGQAVMALHDDGMWHRAKIMSISGLTHTVQYVDLGELKSNLKSNAILPLKKKYIENIPALAVRVIISDLEPSGTSGWSARVANTTKGKLQGASQCLFKKQCLRSGAYCAKQVMINEESYIEHLLSTGLAIRTNDSPARGPTCEVNLDRTNADTTAQSNSVNGKRVVSSSLVDSKEKIPSDPCSIKHQHQLHNKDTQMDKTLKKKKLGFPEQVPMLTGSEVYLSHADYNGTVWLQCRTNSEILHQLERDVNSYIANCKILYEIVVGVACIIRSFKHSKWCRASVKNIKDNEVEVHCIDYGYSESLPFSQVFDIPEELQCISPLSYKCALNLPDSINVQNVNWALLQKVDRDQVLRVQIHSFCSERYVVTVTNKGVNILRILFDSFMQNCTEHQVVKKALRENCINSENSSISLQCVDDLQRDREGKVADDEMSIKSHHRSHCFGDEVSNQQMGFFAPTDSPVVKEEYRKLGQEVSNSTEESDMERNEGLSRSLGDMAHQQNWEDEERENMTKESIQTEMERLKGNFCTELDTGADEEVQSVLMAVDAVIEEPQLEHELATDDSKFYHCLDIERKEVLIHGNEQADRASELALGRKEETMDLHDRILADSQSELCHKGREEAEKNCHHEVMNLLSAQDVNSHEGTVAPFGTELIKWLKEEMEMLKPTEQTTSNAKCEFRDSNHVFSSLEVASLCSDSRVSIENSFSNQHAQMHDRECLSDGKPEFHTTATADASEGVSIGEGSDGEASTFKKDPPLGSRLWPKNELNCFAYQSLTEVEHDTVSNMTCDLGNTETSSTISPKSRTEKYKNFSETGKRPIRFHILQEKVIVQDFIVPDEGEPQEMSCLLQTSEIRHPTKNIVPCTSVKDDVIYQRSDIRGVKYTTQDIESLSKAVKEDQQDSERKNSFTDKSVLIHYYTEGLNAGSSQEKFVIKDNLGDVCESSFGLNGELLVKDLLQYTEGDRICENSEGENTLFDSQVEVCEDSQVTNVERDSYENVPEHSQNIDAITDCLTKNLLGDSQDELISGSMKLNDMPECTLVGTPSGGLNLNGISKDLSDDSPEGNTFEDTKVEVVLRSSNTMEQLHYSKVGCASEDSNIRDVPGKTQKNVHYESLVMSDRTHDDELGCSLFQDKHGDLQLRNMLEYYKVEELSIETDVYEDIQEMGVSQDSKLIDFSGEVRGKNVPEDSEVMDVPVESPVMAVMSKMCEDELFQCVTRDSKVSHVTGDSKVTDVTGDSKVTDVTGDSLLDDESHHFSVQDMTITTTSRYPVQICTEGGVPSEVTSYNQLTNTEDTDILEGCEVQLETCTQETAKETVDRLPPEFAGLEPQTPLTTGTAVYICYFEENEKLWLQRACDTKILNDLSLKINASLDVAQVPSTLHEGMLCLAQSVDDYLWYRAVILSILESGFYVQFIDYGNCGLISIEQVRDIQEDILTEGQLSYECRVKMKFASQENTSLTSLLEAYLDEELILAFVDTNEPESFTLICNTLNILDGYGILEFTSCLGSGDQEGQVFSNERIDERRDERLEVHIEQENNEGAYMEMHIEQEGNEETSKSQKGQLLTKEELNMDRAVPLYCKNGFDINSNLMSTEEGPKIDREQVSSNSEHSEFFREPTCNEEELKSDQGRDNVGKGFKQMLEFMTLYPANTLNNDIPLQILSEWLNVQKEVQENVNEKCKGRKCLEDPVLAEVDDQLLAPKSDRPKGEEFQACKGVRKFKSSLHAIKEVEETEITGPIEVEAKPYNAFLVNIEESPFSLWIQKQEVMELAEFVGCHLKEFGDDLPLLVRPQIDQLCVSLLCGSRQRAQVVDLSCGDATVYYIDHGKSAVVPQRELWKLEDELIDIPPLATQITLPVEVLSARKSGAVLAVAEAALHNMCACLDLSLFAPSTGSNYTLFSAPGFGDVGDLLVKSGLARPVNWEQEIGLHLASTIKRRMELAVSVLHND